MPTDPAEEFANATRAFIVAGAGCGKTEVVARAAGVFGQGRQLVLTHTHAGVRALKDRLRKVGAPRGSVHVDTIAGFALQYAASFPRLSGLTTAKPAASEEWSDAYEAARRVVDARLGRSIISESYNGLYVDDYQDCVIPQHELVLAIADVLPCRLVLDPLQGIFGFAGSLVSLDAHVAPTFDRLPDLVTPHRWRATNPRLGEWLVGIRTDIERGRQIDLRGAPCERGQPNQAGQFAACARVAARSGSAVAIAQWPHDCHSVARRLRGMFTVMEPIECEDLVAWADRLETASGRLRSARLVDFAAVCLTRVGTELMPARRSFERGADPAIRLTSSNRDAISALVQVSRDTSLSPVEAAMKEIEAIPGSILHRRELWREMARTIRLHADGRQSSLAEAAWAVRDRGRSAGRRVEHRTVSRTVLVKGLEFAHAVVLNADAHDGPNLYVALTRASQTLTVLSEHATLAPADAAQATGRRRARTRRPSTRPGSG